MGQMSSERSLDSSIGSVGHATGGAELHPPVERVPQAWPKLSAAPASPHWRRRSALLVLPRASDLVEESQQLVDVRWLQEDVNRAQPEGLDGPLRVDVRAQDHHSRAGADRPDTLED